MISANNVLKTMGLLNVDTPDISELMQHRQMDVQAYCSSRVCMGENRHARSLGVRKYVSRQRAFCAECGSALFWRRIPKSQLTVRSTNPEEG